jgi:hypothetical protein
LRHEVGHLLLCREVPHLADHAAGSAHPPIRTRAGRTCQRHECGRYVARRHSIERELE